MDFPVHGLDMTPYLPQADAPGMKLFEADPSAQDGKELEKPSKQKTAKLNGKKLWSKIKGARGWGKKSTCGVWSPAVADVDGPSQAGDVPPILSAGNDSVVSSTTADKYKYDLYAVVNHYGGLSSGHYTATCRSVTDVSRKWYHLDDDMVSAALERNLKTRNAYILCYTQREAGNERAQSTQSSICHEKMNSAIPYCTEHNIGDTCHFTIDAYSVSDTTSWKSVTSLAHRIKVDCCLSPPQHFSATTTTPSPQLEDTHYSVDLSRATGLEFGEAASVMKIGSGKITDMEGSFGSPTISSSARDLDGGLAQSDSLQGAELRPSVLIGPCLDTEVPSLSPTAEGGECMLLSASCPPKVAWLSNPGTHKTLCEVQQSKETK